MSDEKKPIFERLYEINVNQHTGKKQGLTYLAWSFAWAEFKTNCPDGKYNILKGENNLPYINGGATGLMVGTTVTAEGETHEMWLPVMNGSNKSMKDHEYSYQTKAGERNVEAATMFDVNKAIMRCLVKNLGMFGLGLYIYEGEDLPPIETEEAEKAAELNKAMVKMLPRLDKYSREALEFGFDSQAIHLDEPDKGKWLVAVIKKCNSMEQLQNAGIFTKKKQDELDAVKAN